MRSWPMTEQPPRGFPEAEHRARLALAQAAKATALLADRDYCIPEDIVFNALPVCAHRIISRSTMHEGDTLTARRLMQQILETVPSPA